MSPEEQRASDIRIWIISLLFFFFIIAGGALLGMYIIYPESSETAWYPVAGMGLVAIPWIFWLFTFAYRFCLKPAAGGDGPALTNTKGSLGKQVSGGGSESRKVVQPQEQVAHPPADQIEEGGSSNSTEAPERPLALSM